MEDKVYNFAQYSVGALTSTEKTELIDALTVAVGLLKKGYQQATENELVGYPMLKKLEYADKGDDELEESDFYDGSPYKRYHDLRDTLISADDGLEEFSHVVKIIIREAREESWF